MWSDPYSYSHPSIQNLDKLFYKFYKLDGQFCYHEVCYEALEKVFTRLEDSTDNMQSQDKHWGRLGIIFKARKYFHKPGSVQSACYRPLENYLSNAAYIWA